MHVKPVAFSGDRRAYVIQEESATCSVHSPFANRILRFHNNRSASPARGGSSFNQDVPEIVEARAFRAVERSKGGTSLMNSEMLKFLTQKLKSQSLNEGRTFNPAQASG